MNLGIGTAEPITEEKKKQKERSSLRSGQGASGGSKNRGGGGGGNGGDENFPNNQKFQQSQEEFKPDKSRFVMWFLLLVVVMTFGGLISAYVVISSNRVAEWKPFNLPKGILSLSTFFILASSIAYQISYSKLKANYQARAKHWLLAATALGGMFISSQLLAWLELVRQGVYVKSNQYAGFFYFLTALHAAHVFGGICLLGYLVLRSWQETNNEKELLRRKTFSKVAGWYWHFMGGLWIVLFLLLEFWK